MKRGYVERHSEQYCGRAEFVPNAAVLDEIDAGLESIGIDRAADDGFVLIERGFDVHGDAVEEPFFEKVADDGGAAAVGVELDG